MRYNIQTTVAVPVDQTQFTWMVDANRITNDRQDLLDEMTLRGIHYAEETGRVTVPGTSIAVVRDIAATLSIALTAEVLPEEPVLNIGDSVVAGVPQAVHQRFGSIGKIKHVVLAQLGPFDPATCTVEVAVQVAIKAKVGSSTPRA